MKFKLIILDISYLRWITYQRVRRKVKKRNRLRTQQKEEEKNRWS